MSDADSPIGQVFVFNATATQIRINVNNAPDNLLIFAAATAFNWLPGAARPPLSLCALPAPGVFGLGQNQVAITPVTGGGLVNTVIDVPASVSRGDTLQIYLASESTNRAMWMMLCNGQPIADNIHVT